jgi:hypothetical protein
MVGGVREAAVHLRRVDDVGNGDQFEIRGRAPPHLLVREEAPGRLARGAPAQIPAILLAKLALDSSVHGEGLGPELLVDAIDDHARAFYERHDFEPLPGKPERLVMKLSTAAKALGVPWP